ncbi:C4-dicarboxylate TRAP transporter large permease protein DctM [subsurface metagenome]
MLLVVAVLGSIFLGLATPTEASAVGAFGSIVCAAVHRRLGWHLLRYAAVMTMKMSGMIMWILFAASLFASVYQGLGAQKFAEDLVGMVPFGKWGMLIAFQVIFFILGCLMNTLSVLMITYPVFLPLIPILGFDPLWFAVLFMVNAEMGYLTPPFGTNLFYMKGIAPSGTPIEEIYRAVMPFVALQATGLVLIILFPPICTWLPSLWL